MAHGTMAGMNLRQIEYFIQVAELGSFSKAALRLDVAQPALSRQVRALETGLRETLLLRNGRGVTLTDAGKRLLEHGRDILQRVEAARDDLGAGRNEPAGHIVVGLPPSLALRLTLPLIEIFDSQMPRARLAIIEGFSMHIAEWLSSGRVDLGLVYNPEPAASIEIAPVLEERLCLIGKAGPRPRRSVALKDLGRYPLVMPQRDHIFRRLMETQAALAGRRSGRRVGSLERSRHPRPGPWWPRSRRAHRERDPHAFAPCGTVGGDDPRSRDQEHAVPRPVGTETPHAADRPHGPRAGPPLPHGLMDDHVHDPGRVTAEWVDWAHHRQTRRAPGPRPSTAEPTHSRSSMTIDSALPADFGFAPAHDAPIAYLQRLRSYYQGLGYGAPYEWAHYAEVPFTRLARPLTAARVALVTTAAPYQPDKGDQGPGAPVQRRGQVLQRLLGRHGPRPRPAHLACRHRPPAHHRRRCLDVLSVAGLAPGRRGRPDRLGGTALPRRTDQPKPPRDAEIDAPEIVARCRADEVDAAVLVANCPVCHQTVSLVARALEAEGIATVVMGCAKDIVEYVGVPRFVFSDFPLGNAAGRPHDPGSQAQTLELALALLEAAPAPRTTLQSPLRWSAERRVEARLLQHRAAVARRDRPPARGFDAGKATARELRAGRSVPRA